MNLSVSSSPETFANFDIQILVSTLYQYLIEFDETALSILSTLAAVKTDNSLLDAVEDLPAIICSKVKVKPIPKIKPIESELTKIDTNSTTQEISFNVGSKDTFPDGLNPLPPSAYEANIKFHDILPSDNNNILKSMINFLSRAADEYADVFFLSFVEQVSDETLPIFLYILVNIRVIRITDKIFLKLFFVFQPGVSVFSQCDGFNYVNFYRTTVLHILSIHAPNLVSKLLIFNEPHPFLFADIIGRIQNKLSIFNMSYLTDETTLGTVIKVSSMLNMLYIKGIEPTASQQAMAEIFVYLFALLENKESAAKCLVSPVFASGFLSRVLEPSMQKPIANALHTFLAEFTNENTQILLPLVEFMCGILGVCRSMPKEERITLIAIDILSCVNDAVAHQTSLTKVFAPILVPATLFLVERPSQEFLGQVLYLCSLLVTDGDTESSDIVITDEACVLLSAATRLSEGAVLSESTICGLLNIMANSRATSMKSMFLIKQPKIINVLFSALRDGAQFSEVLAFFNQLCHHSISNCHACNTGEFDLLLLEIVQHFGEEFKFRNMEFSFSITRETVVDSVLPLVTYIASFVSTPQIAMSLISIIKPNKDRTFSTFAESTMKAIGSAISFSSQFPKTATTLGEQNMYIEFQGVKSSYIQGGFTVQFWLQNDGPAGLLTQRCPSILQIVDSQNVVFRLHVSGSSIICNISQSSGLSFAALATNIPSGKWVLYSLVVNFGPKTTQVSFTYNSKPFTTFSASMAGFHDGPLQIRLGGIAQGDDSPPFDCRLGDVWFFGEALDKKRLSELNNMGARASDVGTLALFSYPVTVCASGVSCVISEQQQMHKQTLLEIFCQSMTDFVPFFAFMDTMPAHFPEQLIDLLQCIIPLLKCSPHNSDLFALTATCLMTSPHSKLTYPLYLKFVGFLESCSSQCLVKDLIKHILFNPELWCVCEASHLQRIVSHWANSLFSTSPSAFMKVVSISDVLVIMRLYFWYNPIEVEIIKGTQSSERKRPQNLDVELCRTNLARLIFSMALFKFQIRDAVLILSHCATCADTQQILGLMNVLIDITKAKEKLKFPVHISRLIYHQLKPASEERFLTACKLLCTIDQKDFFVSHLQPILSLLRDSYITSKLYDLLIASLPQFHLFFPICAMLAVSLNCVDSFVMDQLSTIELTEQECQTIVQNEIWGVWLIVLVLNSSNMSDVQEVIIRIITRILFVNPQVNTFDDIFILIDFFATVTDFEIEEFGVKLMTKCSKQILELASFKLCSSFAKRAIKYLFFRINGDQTTNALQQLYESSPYSLFEVNISESQVLKLHPLKTFDELKKIFQHELSAHTYLFMLKLNEQGKVEDEELFKYTCRMLEKVSIPEDDVKFWKRYFNYVYTVSYDKGSPTSFSADTVQSRAFSLELNEFMPAYFSIMNRHFLNAMSSFRKIIAKILEEGERQCVESILALQTNEIGLSANDIDMYAQSLIIERHINQRKLRKHARQKANGNSPWSLLIEAGGLTRSFLFSNVYSQPLLKKRCIKTLSYLPLSEQDNYPFSAFFANKERSVIYHTQCRHIRVSHEADSSALCFFEVFSDFIRIQKCDKAIEFPFKEISCVLVRNRLHRSNSLEFFLKNRKSYLIDFSPKTLSEVLPVLMRFSISKLQTVSQQNFFATLPFTKQWVSGEISNFEYLMKLNLFSGRTFHDMSLYPIFPWVIVDFESEKLDFSDEGKTFRDLSKPVTPQKGFMYMTAPLNPSYVSHFLGKIEPFSSQLELSKDQKIKFTLGEFTSVAKTYESVTSGPNTVELPPEFFFASEYFRGIELPKWCENEFDFVYNNRIALESDYVSQHLNEWIDLIFGCRQRGFDDTNIFNPILFEDVWSNWREIESKTIENSLIKAGHMPPMLFSSPHPKRAIPTRREKSLQTSLQTSAFSLERRDIMQIRHVSNSNGILCYYALCSNAEIVRFQINTESPHKSTVYTFETRLVSTSDVRSSVAVSLDSCFCLIDPLHCNMFVITGKVIEQFPVNITSRTVFACGDSDRVIYSSTDGTIGVWEKETKSIISTIKSASSSTKIKAQNSSGHISLISTQSGKTSNSNENLIAPQNGEQKTAETQKSQISTSSSEQCTCTTEISQPSNVYSDYITAIAFSKNFSCIVFGTKDGSIISNSMYTGQLIFNTKVEQPPKHILITKLHCFVLVSLSNSNDVVLLSCNGEVIKRKPADFCVTAQCTWSSKGRDFICLCDDKGRVRVFDSFTLDLSNVIFNCRSCVQAIDFIEEMSALSVITADGQCRLIPYN